MLDLDVRIDTELRDRAMKAVDKFTTAKEWPVSRTQIGRLLQIASNEPDLLSGFATEQRDRAQARLDKHKKEDLKKPRLASEIAFWELIGDLDAGKGAKVTWSLEQQCERELPGHLKDLKKPHPTAKAERETYNRLMVERRESQVRWKRDHYPGFFRHFCAHYMYRMPPE